jgi:hypothetical protein
MLELTAPHIRRASTARHRELEITDSLLRKSSNLLEKSLTGGNHRTREEPVSIFEKAGIATRNNRASHLLLSAELEGLIGSGITRGNVPTYALLEERVPKSPTFEQAGSFNQPGPEIFFKSRSRHHPGFCMVVGFTGIRSKKGVGNCKTRNPF